MTHVDAETLHINLAITLMFPEKDLAMSTFGTLILIWKTLSQTRLWRTLTRLRGLPLRQNFIHLRGEVCQTFMGLEMPVPPTWGTQAIGEARLPLWLCVQEIGGDMLLVVQKRWP